MCGVIGYVGQRIAKDLLYRGLERLEYRGYDSAGICLGEEEGLVTVKAVGNLAQLKAKAGLNGSSSNIGIAHTRWATHGRVCEANAHPLIGSLEGEIAIVLNGVIENFQEVRDALIADGVGFRSETDAEVVAHLVERFYDGDLVAAVQHAYEQLEGHFAFIVMHRDCPRTLVGVRRRCPLVVGMSEDETFLASSVSAFICQTRQIKLLEDGEVVAIGGGECSIFDRGAVVERPVVEADWDDESADKQGYETFMLKEIYEQPTALRRTLGLDECGGDLVAEEVAVAVAAVQRATRVVLIGCGTAYHAGLAGAIALEELAELPCDVAIASEWRYRRPLVSSDTLVIGVSQSGETADTIAALRLARQRGARTLALTNTPGSQITREVDGVLYTRAGLEMGVAATKTFTAQAAMLHRLALELAEARGTLSTERAATEQRSLRELPDAFAAYLDRDPGIEHIARAQRDRQFFLYLGRHAGLPTCMEGALKLKEISYIPTDAYAAGEMKHGPIALLEEGTPVVAIATQSHVGDKLQSNLHEVRARGASIIAVASEGDERIAETAGEVIRVPRVAPLLQALLAVVPLQLLAYRIACLRGLNVDQPRNLAKTVTVE